MILAIDTSTEQASIALAHGQSIRAESSWSPGRNHSRQLHGAIDHMLSLEEVSTTDLTAIAVACGPGSFSGVRVGMAAAKGIAMGLGVPLVGISTLDIIALQASLISHNVCAVISAGRGDVYLARYTGGFAAFRHIGDYCLASLEEATHAVQTEDMVAGPGADDLLRAAGPHRPQGTFPILRLRRAGYLAELGRRYFEAGGQDQVDNLEPLYLRRSAAEEKLMARTGE